MKAKLQQFYQNRIQPLLEAAKAKMTQIKERLIAWFHRHRPGLQLAAGTAAGLLSGAGLWAFLKTPFEVPEPVLVTPQSPIQDETPVQVDDGRLL
jgi:hypothetical protein